MITPPSLFLFFCSLTHNYDLHFSITKCSSYRFLLSVTVSGGTEEGTVLCSAVKVLKTILKRNFFRARIELYTMF